MADQAKKYLDQVRTDAAKIVVQARQEAAAVRAEAQAAGRQAAREEVEQIIQGQLATVIPALRQAVLEIDQAKQAWLAQWETAGVHLAVEIARRLIRGELTRQPEIPLGLIREALQLAAGGGDVRLVLNPGDHRALGSQVQLLVREMSGLGQPQVLADASLPPGGCRVETRFGSIDQTFEAQLARVEEELRP
jgi:flagellar assembly protein FliH